MTANVRFVVWVHRNAKSIFGAASKPVTQNGALLTFGDKGSAKLECDRHNASSGARICVIPSSGEWRSDHSVRSGACSWVFRGTAQ